MKSTFRLLGIIAIAAVIGFSMTACDNGSTSGSGNGNTLSGIWKCVSSTYFGGVFPGDSRVEFESNGIARQIDAGELSRSGTYELNGEDLQITWTWSPDGMGLGNNGGWSYNPDTKEITWRLINDTRVYAKQ